MDIDTLNLTNGDKKMNINFKKSSEKIFNQITKNIFRLAKSVEYKYGNDFYNELDKAFKKTDFFFTGNEIEIFLSDIGVIWSGDYKKLDRDQIYYAFKDATLYNDYFNSLISKSKLIKILDDILEENEEKLFS